MAQKTLNRIVFYGVAFASLRMLIGATSVVFLFSKNLSLYDIGLLKSFQALVVLFLDIPLSYVSDKFSRKFSISCATLLAALWLIITAASTHVFYLYLAEFFNALSLALFNGAFISYLVDTKNKIMAHQATEQTLGSFYQYEMLAMAGSAFLGSAFVEVHSNLFWWISGLALLLLLSCSPFLLPSDNSNHQVKLPTLFLIKRDFKNIQSSLSKDFNLSALLLIMVLLSFYMQLIIQFWQIMLHQDDHQKQGWVFSMVFTLILLVQSLASRAVAQGLFQKIKSPTLLFLMILSPVLIALPNHHTIVLHIFSILLIFFLGKACLIHFSSQFHDALPSEYRSTFDSLVSVLMRLGVIISFPIVSALGEASMWVFSLFFALSALGAWCFNQQKSKRSAS